MLLKQLRHILQKSLSEALLDYELIKMNDFGKKSRHQTLHLAFQALHAFAKSEKKLPHLWSQVSECWTTALTSLMALLRRLRLRWCEFNKTDVFYLIPRSQTQMPCSPRWDRWMRSHSWNNWTKLLWESWPSQPEVIWLPWTLWLEALPLMKSLRWGQRSELWPLLVRHKAVAHVDLTVVLYDLCRHVVASLRLCNSGCILMHSSVSPKKSISGPRASVRYV